MWMELILAKSELMKQTVSLSTCISRERSSDEQASEGIGRVIR